MAKQNVDKSFLNGMVEVSPGVFQKPKTVLQPREKAKLKDNSNIIVFGCANYSSEINNFENSKTEWSIEFPVDPMGKPRMTQKDKWSKREVTDRYWELKRHMKQIADVYNFKLPEANYHMIFYIPMPDSWPKSKKEQMNLQPHKQRPDKDNLEKGVLDALCPEDSYVWDGRVTKYWAYKGKIVIKNL